MTQTIYPGIIDHSLEFFIDDDNLKFMQSGRVKEITEIPFPVIEQIRKKIDADETLKSELESIHPDSEWNRIETFIKCRYGGLDFYPDISNGVLGSGDYWDCPLRGICKSEGTICSVPTYNGEKLSFTEVKLIKHLTSTKTNESIAEEMEMPLGSFHLLKKKLYEKLGQIQTKQELTIIALKLNIINF